jgi:predicted dehydrogenase
MSIGIIGTGWGARVQVPVFTSVGLEVVGIAGRDRPKTEQLALQHNIGFATHDWRELLARDDVQFVSIVTPPNTHREMAVAALEAGKHVLCEKPMALDVVETQTMVEAARTYSKQYALLDHELRFLPSVQTAQQRIHTGDLGVLRLVDAVVTGQSRADRKRAWNWWSDAEQGGGLLGALGSHQLDLLQFLLGSISAVSATLHTFVTERPSENGLRPVTSDDYASVQLRFAQGGLGTINMSVVASIDEPNRLTAHFEHGALRIEGGRLYFTGPGKSFDETMLIPTLSLPAGLPGSDFEHGTLYLGQALKRALAGDCAALTPAATFVDGHRVQRLLDAARQSSNTNSGWVSINEQI